MESFADLLERIGDVPLDRIRMPPAPGTATEADVLVALEGPIKRICELVEGVLVEKPMGTREGLLGGIILHLFWTFLDKHKIGKAFGADSAMRMLPGLVRIPDVSFVSRQRLRGKLPRQGIAALAPELAVEVISKRNTKKEMIRKLKDYFLSGVQLVWLIYPKTESAEVFHRPDAKTSVAKGGTLDGEDIMPGFTLSLADVFARAEEDESEE
jgi:Uma2 family endonuclease